MPAESLLAAIRGNGDRDAFVWRGRAVSHGALASLVDESARLLGEEGIGPGRVVLLQADFSPRAFALLLAMAACGHIIVPLSPDSGKLDEIRDLAQVEFAAALDREDRLTIAGSGATAEHPLYRQLRERSAPGLVLFSSGSTGVSKGVVHDFARLLDAFRVHTLEPKHIRAVAFLLFDHIGGINTMFQILSGGGCLIVADGRSPDAVLAAVERFSAELLPTSPTFLNLVLLSGALERHDLSSLRTISYGTEPMPEATLRRLRAALPHVRFVQLYGTSEVGILRTRNKPEDSAWIKLGDAGTRVRIVDGLLQIKADQAMLGYLNAPSPFTEDGWFITGDAVEEDGEYIRVRGRTSEIINVGGRKVYPAEVEGVIQEVENVADVVVEGEPNPLTGNIVVARVALAAPEDRRTFVVRLKKACRDKLAAYKVPAKVLIVEGDLHTQRFKKQRRTDA